jgi:hypothetical protein
MHAARLREVYPCTSAQVEGDDIAVVGEVEAA